MSDVIGFADFKNRVLPAPHALASRQRNQQACFTLRDREDLEDWSTADHLVSICSSDTGPFAMLYQAGRKWASWGVARQGRSVLLWDCVTLADIGVFPSMIDALAAVPIDSLPSPVANVLQFAAIRPRQAPIG